MKTLPPFVDEMLAAPPQAGAGGVHNWLFRVARQLHAHLPAGEIVACWKPARLAAGGRFPRLKSLPPFKMLCRARGNRGAGRADARHV